MLLFSFPGDQGKGRQTQSSDCFKFSEGAGLLGMRSLKGEGVLGGVASCNGGVRAGVGCLPFHPVPTPLRLGKSRGPSQGNATGLHCVSKFLTAANVGDFGSEKWEF